MPTYGGAFETTNDYGNYAEVVWVSELDVELSDITVRKEEDGSWFVTCEADGYRLWDYYSPRREVNKCWLIAQYWRNALASNTNVYRQPL